MNKQQELGKKFTIPHDSLWFRPDEAYFNSQEQAKGIDPDEIEWNGKYKITLYGRNRIGLSEKSLEDKLSEVGGKFYKLSKGYWLLVHIGKNLQVNHQAIADKLSAIKAKFNVFSIQEISNHPDTVARFVAYNPKLEAYDINIGTICHKLSKTKIPGTLTINKGKPPKKR